MRLQLDLVDEVQAVAEQRLVRYQNLMSKNYDLKVRHRDFQIGDLVLQKVMGAAKDPTQGKLGPNWEGPYRITSEGKIWFCIPYKTHSGSDIHGSISFMIDNMHYVILRI